MLYRARLLFVFVFLSALVAPANAADRTEELVRIHVEAIGGKERLAALKSLRAAGQVVAGGKKMRFTMLAARPDHVRVETENGGRTLVQGYDGHDAPWEFDTGQWPPRYRDMAAPVAKTFTADSEFDDPLVGGSARGYAVDYAGEVETEGKKLLRLLVTRHHTEVFSLLLDPDTFLIVKRVDEKKNALGGTVHVVTFYADFRPVDGVLLPHQIALTVDGRVTQQTKIESIEPNPEIPADTFSRPRAVTLPGK